MTTEPPLNAGAVQEQTIWVSPGVQPTPLGGFATVNGVAVADADEYEESPAALVANTCTMYAVPFVSPVIVVLVKAESVDAAEDQGVPLFVETRYL